MIFYQRRKIHAVSFLSIVVFFYSFTSSSASNWHLSTPENQGMQSRPILEMMKEIKDKEYNIHSISIVRNGFLVFDAYLHPFKEGQKHEFYSVAKSVTSALIGIAIDKGYVKGVDQTVIELFPKRKIANLDELKKVMTLEDLLSMSSGFNCNDGSKRNWVGFWDMKKTGDWTQYTLDLPMAHPPGKYFDYCNGASHLLSAIIHHHTGMKTIEFAKKYLFNPLGISDIKWETSPEGVNSGFGELWLQPKDMAKIGQLYLNQGIWGENRIISEKWIETSTRPHSDSSRDGNKSRYGYQWWINPIGYFSAIGVFGQVMYVMPGKDLVAVFSADMKGPNQYISHTLFREYIVPAVVASKPLPHDQVVTKDLKHIVTALAEGSSESMIWFAEIEGMARDGVFRRTAAPAFKFEYPLGSLKLETKSPKQIMRMRAPIGYVFTASIADMTTKDDLKDFGPSYAKSLKKIGSNVQVISNKKIKLQCGTDAYRTEIRWLWQNSRGISTIAVAAEKDDKLVYLVAHPIQYLRNAVEIVESLAFE